MVIENAVHEICNELQLLSKYSSIIRTEGEPENHVEYEMLFSGLAVVSQYAEHLVNSGKTPVADMAAESDHANTSRRSFDCHDHGNDSLKHWWMINVLEDMAKYARKNNFPEVSERFDELAASIAVELRETITKFNGQNARKIVSLAEWKL